jgi:hypothetical protein
VAYSRLVKDYAPSLILACTAAWNSSSTASSGATARAATDGNSTWVYTWTWWLGEHDDRLMLFLAHLSPVQQLPQCTAVP